MLNIAFKEFTQNCQVNPSGSLVVYMDSLNEFTAKYPSSHAVLSLKIIGKKSSRPLIGYYYAVVVPTMQAEIWKSGDRKTEEQTDIFLRENSPIMYLETVDLKTGKYFHELKRIPDLSNEELLEHIETIKQLAAEEYGCYIEDPKSL